MGTTKIVCRMCGASATVKNEDREVMREHRCTNPDCRMRMTDHEFVNLKAAYLLRLSVAFRNAFGSCNSRFDYDIDLSMKYVPDWAISAGNGSDTGGSDLRERD